MEITSEIIIELLRERHKDRQWLFFPELVFSTHAKKNLEEADSRVDAWAFNVWPSRNLERISYEIKISRHDLLRELRKPEKREPGLRISNSFYYVIPDGCCEVEEIPKECGLYVIKKPKGKDYYVLSMAKKAPWRDIVPDLGVDFWASFARRVAKVSGEYDSSYNRREHQKALREKKDE